MSNDGCSSNPDPDAGAVLEFWFGDPADPANVKERGKLWFSADQAVDERIRKRFGVLHEQAARGELEDWTGDPRAALALVVLLDQFTRNLYRGSAAAFSNDARALEISRDGVARGLGASLGVVERAFWYMPFQHCEDLEVQRRSVRLYRALVDDSPPQFKPFSENAYEFAVLHCEIIERFGRFPHRNELLGRSSTDEELEYLAGGGHRFGQG
ncbi:MAG TPA: DUF924 family protein [Arenicellales bacterium]|nr:DUF924 family protein [Arenicellales bacterium]